MMTEKKAIKDQFAWDKREGHGAWVHKSKPVWIVGYESNDDSFENDCYHVYYAIEKVRKGAKVWSANNVRVAKYFKEGSKTLDEAMAIGIAKAESIN